MMAFNSAELIAFLFATKQYDLISPLLSKLESRSCVVQSNPYKTTWNNDLNFSKVVYANKAEKLVLFERFPTVNHALHILETEGVTLQDMLDRILDADNKKYFLGKCLENVWSFRGNRKFELLQLCNQMSYYSSQVLDLLNSCKVELNYKQNPAGAAIIIQAYCMPELLSDPRICIDRDEFIASLQVQDTEYFAALIKNLSSQALALVTLKMHANKNTNYKEAIKSCLHDASLDPKKGKAFSVSFSAYILLNDNAAKVKAATDLLELYAQKKIDPEKLKELTATHAKQFRQLKTPLLGMIYTVVGAEFSFIRKHEIEEVVAACRARFPLLSYDTSMPRCDSRGSASSSHAYSTLTYRVSPSTVPLRSGATPPITASSVVRPAIPKVPPHRSSPVPLASGPQLYAGAITVSAKRPTPPDVSGLKPENGAGAVLG